MTVEGLREQKIFQEAISILIDHMEPARATRVWASLQIGEGDYLSIKDNLFDKETVEKLYKKVWDFQVDEEMK
jgi:hypothetical protein